LFNANSAIVQLYHGENNNINQDLTTDTTTLIIKKNELRYGEWNCYHGTHIGFDSLDIKMPGKYWQLRTNNVKQV
jgi:hypothetical protein